MEACLFLFIIFAIFAVGDMLGVATKSRISGIFIVMIVFIVGFLCKVIPADILTEQGRCAPYPAGQYPLLS